MDPANFTELKRSLSEERLAVYGRDPQTVMARYAWNTALCESLYTSLQFAEITLRNAIHATLTQRANSPAWYDTLALTHWQGEKVLEAKQALSQAGKSLVPGKVVAELNFGFWTGFFNRHHTHTGLAACILKHCFPAAPRNQRVIHQMDQRWKRIRDLRNRVFHHERIIHWTDLPSQHAAIMEIISWMEPAMDLYAKTIDRFPVVHGRGTAPWLPTSASVAQDSETITITDTVVNASSGIDTPFGHRYGGDVFSLDAGHLAALMDGKILMLDVQSEYIAYLQLAESAKLEKAIKANLRGLGYGG